MSDSILLSRLSLGTWTYAGDSIWSVSSESESIRVIQEALDRGVALFDTSPNYGNGRSESILGKALGNKPLASVATKCKVDGLTRSELISIVENSLKNLQRDTIDLMQVHWPASDPGQSSFALDVFQDLVREGKIKNLGVCNFGVHDLDENSGKNIISNQLPYNLMWRVIEEGIAEKSRELDMKVISYSPLQQGLLTGKYTSLHDFPSGRKRTRHFLDDGITAKHGDRGMERETQSCLGGFLRISAESGISPLNLAVSYILSHDFIDSMLAGARNLSQLEQLISAIDTKLPEDVKTELDRVSQPLLEAIGGNPDMYNRKSRVR